MLQLWKLLLLLPLLLLLRLNSAKAQQLEGLRWTIGGLVVNTINFNDTRYQENIFIGNEPIGSNNLYTSICDSNGNLLVSASSYYCGAIVDRKGFLVKSLNPRYNNMRQVLNPNPFFKDNFSFLNTGKKLFAFTVIDSTQPCRFNNPIFQNPLYRNSAIQVLKLEKIINSEDSVIIPNSEYPLASPYIGELRNSNIYGRHFNYSLLEDGSFSFYSYQNNKVIQTIFKDSVFIDEINEYPIMQNLRFFNQERSYSIFISPKQDRLCIFGDRNFSLFKINKQNGRLYDELSILNSRIIFSEFNSLNAQVSAAFTASGDKMFFTSRSGVYFDSSEVHFFSVDLKIWDSSIVKNSIKGHFFPINLGCRENQIGSGNNCFSNKALQINLNGDIIFIVPDVRKTTFLKLKCPDTFIENSNQINIELEISDGQSHRPGKNPPQLSTVVFRNADKFQVMATRRIICVGDTTSLRAFGATVDRFRWQGPPGLNNDTIWDPTFRAIAPGFYTWNVSGSSVCTTATNSITVQVVERLPSNLLGGDVSICPANSRVLSVQNPQAGWSYRWNTGATSPSISVDSVGIYWVEVSNGGCTVRDSILVSQAAQPPVPVVTASNLALCAGQETELAGPVGNNLSYLWNTGATTRVIRVGAGVYSLRVVNTLSGCTSLVSSPVEVIALPAPPIPEVLASGPTRFCEGGQVSLSGPIGNFRYRWNTGDTSRVILVNRSGTFRLRLISNLGCEGPFSLAKVVTVEPKPNGSIFGPNIVCPSSEGTVFRFVPNDSGISIDSLNFQWSVVGGTIVSSGGDSILIRWPSGRSDTAKIQVLATSRLGCVGDTVSLNIRINPRLEPLIPQGPNSLCSNASIGNYSAPGTIGSTYNWNIVGGTILSGQGSNRVAVNWNPVGPWSLSYQERLTTSDTVCEGTSPVLNITINPSPREDLRITGNSTFCGVATTQISLLGEGSSTYRWEVGELIIQGDSNRNSINLQALRTGVYPIRVQETNSFGCSGPVYVDTLRFNPVPVAIAGENISFCANGSGVLGATNNPELTYRWEPSLGLDNANISQPRVSLNQAGEYVYRLIVQNSFGCLDTSEVRVNVFALPSKPTFSGNPSACEGDTVVLRVNNPQTENTYRWLTSAGAISGNVIRVNTSQQVVLEARNIPGCSTLSDTLNIIIYPLPPRPTIALQTDSLLCEGEPFQLSGPPAAGYRWSNGANTQSQSLTGSQQISLRTLSVEGCLSPPSVPVNLRYLDVPLPSLAHNNPLLCPEKLSGTYSVRGGIGSTYQFSVVGGTITSSNDTSVTINFEQGNITRSLTVIETTERGCLSGPITLSFQVDELLENPNSPCQLSDFPPIIPNIITPNADGFNDRFEVKNLRYYPNAELVIFNRFGKQLFQLQPYDNSFSATSLPAGTYYYLFHSGRGQTFKGWVEVVH